MVKLVWTFLLCLAATSFAAPATPDEALLKRYEKLKTRVERLHGEYSETLERLKLMEGRMVDIATIAEGRLTTETGVALSTSDRNNQTTIYYTPYKGNRVSLYNGTKWTVTTFTERSLALSGLTANTNYDVFLFDNSGTLTLELTAWSSDTARATALLSQDGVYVRTGATTRRYLGTIRTTSTTQTQDSRAQRFVWNYQNRLARTVYVAEATNTWTYTTNTWRAANNSTTNRVEYVAGLADVLVEVSVMAIITNGTGTLTYYAAGVGVDSTSANSAQVRGSGSSNSMINQVWGDYSGYPGLGYHYLQWLEISAGTSITVWGDNGAATSYQSGLLGVINA